MGRRELAANTRLVVGLGPQATLGRFFPREGASDSESVIGIEDGIPGSPGLADRSDHGEESIPF